MKIVVALALLGALPSCRFIPGTQAHDIREAQDAVRQGMMDPDAAQFRNDHAAGKIICGEVNGKNRLGAYIGFRPYAYDPETRRALLRPELDGSVPTAMAIIDFPCR